MTTSVVVKARAWGATVAVSSEGAQTQTLELGPHEDRTFQVEPGESFNFQVSHGTEPKEAASAEGTGLGEGSSELPGVEKAATLGAGVEQQGRGASSRPLGRAAGTE
jgi:hypothetical protein